jgi:hypothetical protein
MRIRGTLRLINTGIAKAMKERFIICVTIVLVLMVGVVIVLVLI